ncbi:lysozyme inhibitor LprI family protein [Ciceribacter sp. RN22]|uniref:lysozyme inhibitor LprI family protein n=1 Tax=Ciceribacter sp. RN22 TaxID=2954932 RepID=UPI0020931854|nr:lysozyme inhibitor LprI family protein [Ciceribacter sp. RN22]MCO6179224.1 DUF1311 domain-containing protein [Ciceribacter sp. RN22]
MRALFLFRLTSSSLQVAAALALICLAPAAAFAQVDVSEACDEILDTVELAECAESELAREDARLNAAYQQARRVIGEREGKVEGYATGYLEALTDAQRTWIAYRDRKCEVDSWSWRGGSQAALHDISCRLELTRVRRGELDALGEPPEN